MTYRWILFDADGTLFDYDLAEAAALEALWTEAGLPARDDLLSTYRRINGALWKQFESGAVTPDEIKVERFRGLIAELGLTANAAQLSASYLTWLSRQIDLLPGAESLITALAATRRLAMITNGLAEVQRPRVDRSPIGRHFDPLVISEEVGFAKPDPRIFERALDMMGRPPKDEVLMVGDNPLADIAGASRFGFATCWVNLDARAARNGIDPTYEIHALSQLEELLKEN